MCDCELTPFPFSTLFTKTLWCRMLRSFYKSVRQFFVLDEATTAVEYAVMLALILMAVIAAIGTFGSQTGGLWGNTNTQFESHGFGS